MPDTFESKIGFDAVRREIERLCSSEHSLAYAAKIKCENDFRRINIMLSQVTEMLKVMDGEKPMPMSPHIDMRQHFAKIKAAGTHLETKAVSALRRQIESTVAICGYFEKLSQTDNTLPALRSIAATLQPHAHILREINNILTVEGEIKDTASRSLADIRQQASGLGARIANAMRHVISRGIADGFLDAETSPSVRDGRLVVPVAPMHKRNFKGILHDESATGKTVYIEPAEVVELNNLRRELEIEERREILRILVTLTDAIRPCIDDLSNNSRTLAYLDFVYAKAKYAMAAGGTMPQLHDRPMAEWYGARHPVLQNSLQKQGRTIVPLNLNLDARHRILIVSGPNAGGKSVALKTTGIVQYMMQCGVLPTVYENSHMGIFKKFMADIGDGQSIEDDLSTYSSHLRNMKTFLQAGDENSLLLIDEFGAGTEPQIGGAIAQSLLKRFNQKTMWGVITTHYQNLKTMAENTPGLVNGSMLYDRAEMKPLFMLSIGYPGSSFAIEIARKTGLPSDVIDDASQIVGDDYINLDKCLLEIARDRRYWQNKRDRIKQREKQLEETIAKYEEYASELRQNRRVLIEDARKQAAEIIAGSNATVERTIRDIKNANADRERTLQAREKLALEKKKLNDALADDQKDNHPLLAKQRMRQNIRNKKEDHKNESRSRPVAVGDTVLLDNSGRPGTVLELDTTGKKATVAFGDIKMNVKTDRLSQTKRKDSVTPRAASFISVSTSDNMRQRQLDFKQEIDVRGMRADEAQQAVTYFIDDALAFNIGRVRILHGTGTGALRQVIRQYLATVQGVAGFHDEDVRFGGAGITVVEL